jgi:hypothetical protein
MELINLYVKEVGRRLPEKMREDIEKEIHSLIEDALADQSQIQGREPDEMMIVEVLKRFGPPEKMAASYLPPRYLIGPVLYPHFISTLKVVLSVITVLAAIGMGVSLGMSSRLPGDLALVTGRAVLQLIDVLFRASAAVVLVFAVMQWAGKDFKAAEKTWDPRQMKPEPQEDQVSAGERIAEIVFTILALVVFNLYPQWIGLIFIQNGQVVSIPIMTAAFFQYLPWLSLIWALDIGLNIILLSQGRWQRSTRWMRVGLNVAGIVLGVFVLVGPNLLSLDPAAFSRLGLGYPSLETLQSSNQAINNAIRLAIGIALATSGVELGKNLYKLLLRSRLAALAG